MNPQQPRPEPAPSQTRAHAPSRGAWHPDAGAPRHPWSAERDRDDASAPRPHRLLPLGS